MAVPALGRARSAHLMAHPVDARRIIRRLLVVTARAIRRRHLGIMHHLLDAIVTVNAIQPTVHGLGKTVGGKERQRRLLTVRRALVGRIRMAIQTIRILQLLRRAERARQTQKAKYEKLNPRSKFHVLYCFTKTLSPTFRALRITWHILAGPRPARRPNQVVLLSNQEDLMPKKVKMFFYTTNGKLNGFGTSSYQLCFGRFARFEKIM